MADPRGPSSKIQLRVVNRHDTASVRVTVNRDDLTESLGRIYQAVDATLAKQRVQPSGSKFARYHQFGDMVDLEAGVPVPTPIQPDGDVKPSQLPGGPAVLAVHAGPYEGLAATYDALETWMRTSGRKAAGGPWEIYLTDPSMEPDAAKWLTEVIWPLSRT